MTNDFTRDGQLQRLCDHRGRWDIIVIGGGATGVGVALDAATRGYQVALLEQHDFGKGTSSRSTKLIHGGVRYLQQGNVGLVREALHERGLLCENAPHLVRRLPTIIPLYKWWEPSYYWLGLKAYDRLAGRLSLGKSSFLTAEETAAELPTIRRAGLRGGIRYYDANFDDARLLINLAQTAVAHGAVCLNYARVHQLTRRGGKISGVRATEIETGSELELEAAVVVNAAGPFSDGVRRLEGTPQRDWIVPSQGAHVVLDREFLPSESAMIVPWTSDGRVIFAIPWQGHTLVGTTDTPLAEAPLEPLPRREEIDFLLNTVGDYLERRPTWSDIRSTFAGVRPLVRADGTENTAKLARDHMIRVSDAGLVSILGGKWTIFRRMAQDCVDHAAQVGGLPAAPCMTEKIPIADGSADEAAGVSKALLPMYGAAAVDVTRLVQSRPEHFEQLDQRLPYVVGEAVWAVRHEMARTVEDVLARRLRMLFLNASAALAAAPRVAKVLAEELGHDDAWQARQIEDFRQAARGYLAETIG